MITVGFLLCLVLCVGFGVAIPAALRADKADHLLHKPGTCNECDES